MYNKQITYKEQYLHDMNNVKGEGCPVTELSGKYFNEFI